MMSEIDPKDYLSIIRIMGDALACKGGVEQKKETVLKGLCRLIKAGTWRWGFSRQEHSVSTSCLDKPEVCFSSEKNGTHVEGFCPEEYPKGNPAFFAWRPLGSGDVGWVWISRRSSSKEFSLREKNLARVLLQETPWLYERNWLVREEFPSPPKLYPRLKTVLKFQLEGMGRKQIAWELGISENTVAGYVRELYRKLGVHSQPELLRKYRVGELYSQGEGI